MARERSFLLAASKASKSRISQPSVSIQIKKLDQSLEVKLFDRLGRQIYLTGQGATVLEHAKKLTEIISNIENELKDIRRGKLSAGQILILFDGKATGKQLSSIATPPLSLRQRLCSSDPIVKLNVLRISWNILN